MISIFIAIHLYTVNCCPRNMAAVFFYIYKVKTPESGKQGKCNDGSRMPIHGNYRNSIQVLSGECHHFLNARFHLSLPRKASPRYRNSALYPKFFCYAKGFIFIPDLHKKALSNCHKKAVKILAQIFSKKYNLQKSYNFLYTDFIS